jgi:hypothetical protein
MAALAIKIMKRSSIFLNKNEQYRNSRISRRKVVQYNTLDFIDSDPVQIPHLYSKKEDIEIAGFLSATIAWGNQNDYQNAYQMMELMDNAPYDFVISHTESDLEKILRSSYF